MKADFNLSASLSIQENLYKTPEKARLTDIVLPENYNYRVSSNPQKKKYNRYFLGDNLKVLGQLLSEGYQNKFSLIYIDPPYLSQKTYKHSTKSKEYLIEQNSYSDNWKSILSYLEMLYPRLLAMKKLLKKDGSIFIHLDWRIGHYVKILLDEIFGIDNFRNEIIWCYYGPASPKARQFNRKHQSIFWYTKSKNRWKFYKDAVRLPYSKTTLQKINSKKNGFNGTGHDFSKGKIPEDWWSDIPITQRFRHEVVNFETQKPKKLLERIIKATTKKGDLVGDFFSGSGTSAVMADELDRNWITSDISMISLKLTKKRLRSNFSKPFLIEKFSEDSKNNKILPKIAITKLLTKTNLTRKDEIRIDSLGVDKNYDGNVFKGLWVDKIKTNNISIKDIIKKMPQKKIAIKFVDIFGNEYLKKL